MYKRGRWLTRQIAASTRARHGVAGITIAALMLITPAAAQVRAPEATASATPQHQVAITLWPDGAPGSVGTTAEDTTTLTPYLPQQLASSAAAVVICPGGGYAHLAMDHEGQQVADWFTSRGITAFVLKYRLGPRYHHPSMLQDVQRAIRYVRTMAPTLKLRPDRIGIIGFSAGGHLASTAATHFDEGDPTAADVIEQAGSRPDFLILGYPVITMADPFAHKGSREHLLGSSPDPTLMALLSNEKQVTSRTPPTFLFHTDDDDVVRVANSLMFYRALKQAGVPAELHIYAHGKHGVGFAPDDPVLSTWPSRLADWLRVQGLLPE